MKNDFFSIQSNHYANYRPSYPAELYAFIQQEINNNKLAWDVATGSGQAALELSHFFKQVYASDISENQLHFASKQNNIQYKIESAESCSLVDYSADLITIATAIHWFDQAAFFKEANRVLKPGGILFAWSYGGCKISEQIDKVVDHFNFEFLLDYWPEGAKVNWIDRYQSLQLPFHEVITPGFTAIAHYTMLEFMNYMFSWSGVQQYIKIHNTNPLTFIEEPLLKCWGDPNEKREIKWPLHSKCSRK